MVLYHASRIKNLKLIKPQKTLSHNKYIGDFVFATANKKLATMYLVPKGVATLMNPDSDSPNIVICSGKDEFVRKDTGGAIYSLSDKDFTRSPQKEIREYEMASTSPVEPVGSVVYDSTIEALTSAGIDIRLVNKEVFEQLIRNPNQQKIIERLELYKP